MVRKMKKSFVFFLVATCFTILFSCKKKYDYGNIVVIDNLAESGSEIKKNIPKLGEKVSVTADWNLDERGIKKVVDQIKLFPNNFVELDLKKCAVPYGKLFDRILQKKCFAGLENLGSVILPDEMVTVCSGMFEDCVNLQKIVFSNELTSIEGHAFRGCCSLQEIYTAGTPIYIFSYDGDGLDHPEKESQLKNVKIFYAQNETDYSTWYKHCWDYSKRIEPKKISFAEVWASSSQTGYDANHLVDNNWGTWFENDSGDGVGQEIVMHFTRMNSVSTITFKNGNGNTKNFWDSNRVKDLDIFFGNDPRPVSITLKDSCEKQTFRFLYGNRKTEQFEKIKFVIKSVYSGGKGNETAIAEISLNDEEMTDYGEDPYTREMLRSINFASGENEKTVYKIWRSINAYPVMLSFTKKSVGEKTYTENLNCYVYDGTQWTKSQRQVWSQIISAMDSSEKYGKKMEFLFDENDFEDEQFDFAVQLKRPVEQFSDAFYGEPYVFDFDGQKFQLRQEPDFSAKRISSSTEDFFEILSSLSPHGIYRIDLHGELTPTFLNQFQDKLSAEKDLAINRNYILNMWDCVYADELQNTLVSDSICGYFIQLVLPSSTRKILKSAITVNADIISIPSEIQKIEPGAFISSHGSAYDFYQNSVAFDGKNFSRNYSLEGRLLLESIPDSGGEKRILLYCGNAEELLGKDNGVNRNLVLPSYVTKIAPYAFYGSTLDSIVLPSTFVSAGEKCFDKTLIKKIDLSAVNVEKFSMETARQFGLLLSSNPDISVDGDFYCISASGKMTEGLIQKIYDELEKRSDKKVYLDLSGTSLVWVDSEKKNLPLPEMFLYDYQNLYWISMGKYNYLPSNTCRDCHQLRCVHFMEPPEMIAEPSFKGCHATAAAIVNGEKIPLWDYACRFR